MVLEAMSNGLPVVSLDIGGPGVMVDDTCGRVIETGGAKKADVIHRVGDAMIDLAKDAELRAHLRDGALKRSREYEWSTVVRRFYSEVSAQ